MSVRLTSQESVTALYDSVTGFAFGPTFEDEEDAQHFLTWLRDQYPLVGPRRDPELVRAYARWLEETS